MGVVLSQPGQEYGECHAYDVDCRQFTLFLLLNNKLLVKCSVIYIKERLWH